MGAGFIFSTAFGTAVVCGLWTGVCAGAASPMLVTWVGFVGCTSYFTAGCGRNGFIRSLCSNYMGILIGCTIIALGNVVSSGVLFSALCTGFFSGVICYLSHCDLTKVAACTFMGGFSAFATGGNWQMLMLCLLLGNFVGLGRLPGTLFLQQSLSWQDRQGRLGDFQIAGKKLTKSCNHNR